MNTEYELVVAFDATKEQQDRLKAFCLEKLELSCRYYVSIKQPLSDDISLCLTLFQNNPQVYVGILSNSDNSILTDAKITDHALELALKGLNRKYDYTLTREMPLGSAIATVSWMRYFNSGQQGIRIKLNK